MNGIYALPFLALAIGLAGTLVLVEAVSKHLAERMAAPVMRVLLAATLSAILLGATGGIWSWLLMDHFGYRLCETRSGTRVSWTLWSRAPEGCNVPPGPTFLRGQGRSPKDC